MDFIMFLELAGWVVSWLIGNMIFAGYEAHVPMYKRALKLAILVGVLAAVHILAGRLWFYVSIGFFGMCMAFVHGWWFHHRHGVNWRTAQPRDKYLKLIGKSART